MHVISKQALEAFWDRHPQARGPLAAWYRVISTGYFAHFLAIKKTFSTADYVRPVTVFDIGGNHFRLVSVIHYSRQTLYVREVLTHAEYDRWNKRRQQGKHS
jgi:mRNA interferase HigB